MLLYPAPRFHILTGLLSTLSAGGRGHRPLITHGTRPRYSILVSGFLLGFSLCCGRRRTRFLRLRLWTTRTPAAAAFFQIALAGDAAILAAAARLITALRIAVLGCGRIGQMHAANIGRHPRTSLPMVYDIDSAAAAAVAEREGARAAASAEEILASAEVDAVLIATATPTHADYIEMAVEAGKAALCEKPIDLDLARVEACKARIAGSSL